MAEMNKAPTGYMMVRVFSGRNLFPLAGALVMIRSRSDPDSRLLVSARTDAAGQTERFSLETEPRENSLSPGEPEAVSRGYDVMIKKEGYQTEERGDEPIFDGITSLLNVQMLPLDEYGPRANNTSRDNSGSERSEL